MLVSPTPAAVRRCGGSFHRDTPSAPRPQTASFNGGAGDEVRRKRLARHLNQDGETQTLTQASSTANAACVRVGKGAQT